MFAILSRLSLYFFAGGGSAGAVVANRLSENPHWRVLLLEAGGHETEISDVPSLAAYLQLGSMDWKYKTEPQPGRACLGTWYSRNLGRLRDRGV